MMMIDDDGTKDNVKFRDGGRVERETLKVEAEIVWVRVTSDGVVNGKQT